MSEDLQNQISNFKSGLSLALLEAFKDYEKQNSIEQIRKAAFLQMEKSKQNIMRMLLGFKQDSWGHEKWTLDHCNGRSGNSAAGDYIRKAIPLAVEDWLAQANLDDVKFTKSMEKTMKEEFQKQYKEALKRAITDLAESKALELIEQFKSTTEFDQIIKTLSLIEPTKPNS